MGRKRRRREDENDVPSEKRQRVETLPGGGRHYECADELPGDLKNYFRQRYTTWSKYSDGICMTENSWYEVTQEPIAVKIAQHLAAMTPVNKSIIVDAFCGVGGNTIAFALSGRWKRVYAIEKDAATLECARRNASVYGVQDKITWFLGDCFELLGSGPNATSGLKELVYGYGVIFGSPPWGGPGYRSDKVFDLEAMRPHSIDHICNEFSAVTKHLTLYLPRTSDLRQIAELVGPGKKCQVIHYCTRGSSRALCAYLGDFEKRATKNLALE